MSSDLPWELRLEHQGYSHLTLNWKRGNIHFDPHLEPEDNDVVILLWSWPERILATAEAIRNGKKIRVVAAQEILDWLAGFGAFEGYANSAVLDGCTIQLHPYEPFPDWTWPESIQKIAAGLRSPKKIVRRLYRKRKLPFSMPRIATVRFPSGVQFLHLNLSLHREQKQSWVREMQQKIGTSDWILCGCDYHQDEILAQNLPFFEGDLILITDLLSDSRRALGLPTQLLTPVVDRFLDQFSNEDRSKQFHVFAAHASFRFNQKSLTPT